MLEVGLVVRAGREEDDARVVAVRAGGDATSVSRSARKNGASRWTLALAEEFGQQSREDDAVLQRVARAGGRLGAVGEDDELTRRRRGTSRPRRGGATSDLPRRRTPWTGAEEAGVGDRPARAGAARRGARAAGPYRSASITSSKRGPLDRGPLRDRTATRRRKEQRDRSSSRAGRALRVAVDVVGDPVLADECWASGPSGPAPRRGRGRRIALTNVCQWGRASRPTRSSRRGPTAAGDREARQPAGSGGTRSLHVRRQVRLATGRRRRVGRARKSRTPILRDAGRGGG